MPYRRRYRKKRYRKKRSRYGKKRNYRSRSLMRRPVNIQSSVRQSMLRQKFKSNLLYADFFQFDPTSSTPAIQIFSCNSLFDPDRTSLGHQPRGFNQLMLFYDHYTVIASKITAQFGDSNGANAAAMAGISIFDDATPRDLTEMRECGTSKSVVITRNVNKTVSMSCNPAKFVGRSHPLSDPDLRGDAITLAPNNPIEECFFHVWVSGQGLNLGTTSVSITINYVAIFTEPITPDESTAPPE